LLIETYFQQIQNAINAGAAVQSFNITFDKRGSHTGFIRAEIHFIDNSILHVREYVDVEVGIERLMYTYHFVDSLDRLIFRYDNTGHHKSLNLPTYPHHKHLGGSNEILSSPAPEFAAVLSEIEAVLTLPE